MTVKHFGWMVSPYSAKTRAYLHYKGVDFEDRVPNLFTLSVTIKKAVGRPVMPTVQLNNGQWLQDTSDIIDAIETRHPDPSILPPTPCQRVASFLIELFADEWLPMVMMFTRWTYADNRPFVAAEFARSGLPFLPSFLGRRVVRPVMDKMESYLPILGVRPELYPAILQMTQALIAALNQHLAEQPYILGGRPSLGDFSLFGPLWAHCYRDPGSRFLFDDAPHVVDWFERLQSPQTQGEYGPFLEEDQIPHSLDPLFRQLFEGQWPYLVQLVEQIDAYCAKNPEAKRVPRALGEGDFTLGGETGRRKLLTFSQWMMQRPISAYQSLSTAEKAEVDGWLSRYGAEGALDIQLKNPLERRNFKMVLKR